MCPDDRHGGDRFLLRPFQVEIPRGIKKGKVFNVEANNRQYRVRCPKGKRAGDMLIIQIPEFPEPGASRNTGHGTSGVREYEVPQEYMLKVENFDQGDQMEIPSDIICPVTQEIMVDPVVAMDGHSYERSAIEQWLTKKKTSPQTNEDMGSNLVVPNHNLRKRIMEFIESFQDFEVGSDGTARGEDEDAAVDLPN